MTFHIKKPVTVVLVAVCAFLIFTVGGCEQRPSVPLAPDTKMPDVSKMSQAQINDLIKRQSPDRHK